MVLGTSIETFTLIHVVISLAGITSGIIVMYGFLTDQRLDRWTAVFLLTTALTSVTGAGVSFTPRTRFDLDLIDMSSETDNKSD